MSANGSFIAAYLLQSDGFTGASVGKYFQFWSVLRRDMPSNLGPVHRGRGLAFVGYACTLDSQPNPANEASSKRNQMRFWVVLALVLLAGPAVAAKRYSAPSDADAQVQVSVPWLQEKRGLDDWSNLTVWDFTDDPAGEMLGIVKFRTKSKDQTVRLRSGRRIQLVMHTMESTGFGQVGECGVALIFKPETAGQYMLTFEYPVQAAQD